MTSSALRDARQRCCCVTGKRRPLVCFRGVPGRRLSLSSGFGVRARGVPVRRVGLSSGFGVEAGAGAAAATRTGVVLLGRCPFAAESDSKQPICVVSAVAKRRCVSLLVLTSM